MIMCCYTSVCLLYMLRYLCTLTHFAAVPLYASCCYPSGCNLLGRCCTCMRGDRALHRLGRGTRLRFESKDREKARTQVWNVSGELGVQFTGKLS